MGNWVTTGFAASRRTMNIFQPAIGSFYDGFQYSSKELVNAREPWSGWIAYDGGLAVLEQFTQFATLGWENDDNTAGIWRAIPQASKSELGTGNPPSGARACGASYTTLSAPDATDFSTVIINDSKYTKTYRIAPSGLSLGADATAELWETRAADSGEAYDANYLHPVGELTPSADGSYTFTVKPWSALTFTTLDHATTGAGGALVARDGYGSALPHAPEYSGAEGGRDVLDTDASGQLGGVTDDATLYADDFDYAEQPDISGYDPATGALVDTGESFLAARGAQTRPDGTPAVQSEDLGVTPRYTNDTNGAFELVATSDAAHGRVLRQQVGPGMAGGAWNAGDPEDDDRRCPLGELHRRRRRAVRGIRFAVRHPRRTGAGRHRQWPERLRGRAEDRSDGRVDLHALRRDAVDRHRGGQRPGRLPRRRGRLEPRRGDRRGCRLHGIRQRRRDRALHRPGSAVDRPHSAGFELQLRAVRQPDRRAGGRPHAVLRVDHRRHAPDQLG